ncbi:MAG: hypothetical protein KAS32_08955 [Candidatus Peribacteraceae bacterium]|nr:hypothetical protein [Candidatus Peribacteraceae bacterium]
MTYNQYYFRVENNSPLMNNIVKIGRNQLYGMLLFVILYVYFPTVATYIIDNIPLADDTLYTIIFYIGLGTFLGLTIHWLSKFIGIERLLFMFVVVKQDHNILSTNKFLKEKVVEKTYDFFSTNKFLKERYYTKPYINSQIEMSLKDTDVIHRINQEDSLIRKLKICAHIASKGYTVIPTETPLNYLTSATMNITFTLLVGVIMLSHIFFIWFSTGVHLSFQSYLGGISAIIVSYVVAHVDYHHYISNTLDGIAIDKEIREERVQKEGEMREYKDNVDSKIETEREIIKLKEEAEKRKLENEAKELGYEYLSNAERLITLNEMSLNRSIGDSLTRAIGKFIPYLENNEIRTRIDSAFLKAFGNPVIFTDSDIDSILRSLSYYCSNFPDDGFNLSFNNNFDKILKIIFEENKDDRARISIVEIMAITNCESTLDLIKKVMNFSIKENNQGLYENYSMHEILYDSYFAYKNKIQIRDLLENYISQNIDPGYKNRLLRTHVEVNAMSEKPASKIKYAQNWFKQR